MSVATPREPSRHRPGRPGIRVHLTEHATPALLVDAILDGNLEHASGDLAATWRGWPVNERRVALALATTPGGPYTTQAQAEVGIKKSSVRYALQALTDRAEVVEIDGTHVLTDPLLSNSGCNAMARNALPVRSGSPALRRSPRRARSPRCASRDIQSTRP